MKISFQNVCFLTAICTLFSFQNNFQKVVLGKTYVTPRPIDKADRHNWVFTYQSSGKESIRLNLDNEKGAHHKLKLLVYEGIIDHHQRDKAKKIIEIDQFSDITRKEIELPRENTYTFIFDIEGDITRDKRISFNLLIEEDFDKDNVWGDNDKCKDQKGSKETGGCPDADKDGIVDEDDKCPNKAGEEKYEGCPDTDEDGVPDHEDNCNGTKPGVSIDANGCPIDPGDKGRNPSPNPSSNFLLSQYSLSSENSCHCKEFKIIKDNSWAFWFGVGENALEYASKEGLQDLKSYVSSCHATKRNNQPIPSHKEYNNGTMNSNKNINYPSRILDGASIPGFVELAVFNSVQEKEKFLNGYESYTSILKGKNGELTYTCNAFIKEVEKDTYWVCIKNKNKYSKVPYALISL